MESIGRLAGSVAHDFNNLLFPILGYAEMLLLEIPADDRRHVKVAEIRKAAERARELTRQLLAFSRKQVLEMKTVNLCRVVSEFERILRRTIREDVELRTCLASRGNIKADASQIEQVLMNLAVNAQDAMPNGGKLMIETADVILDETYTKNHPDARPGPHVMLAVSDTGVGMDGEILKMVFEPFFTTKTGKGTGLGLSTVHGIIKQHDGSMSVDSKSDHGTTFKINFPRVDAAVESASPPAPRTRVPCGDETVLVVEDDEAVRRLVCTILEKHGYRTLAAGDPDECLGRMEQHEGPVQMLLTDVVLPQKNGRELYLQLKRFLPRLKVLYLSGYAGEVISHHGVLEESVDFISKPVSVQDLIGKVREVLDR
ncbi:MAG: response regulator [bacterium]|nr:response regulator [bacterium]